MKKKLLVLGLALLMQTGMVFANTQVKVASMNEFKTAAPSKTLNVEVLEEAGFGDYTLKAGDVINCAVIDVDKPKRGKRDASFYVQAVSFESNGGVTKLDKAYIGKYSKTVLSKEELKNIDYAKVAEKTVLTVGNYFVKGLSTGVAFVQGVAENKDDGRIKSGVKKAYKESPLSYVEKGTDLDIKPNDTFYLVFKIVDQNAEAPNYSYQENAQ